MQGDTLGRELTGRMPLAHPLGAGIGTVIAGVVILAGGVFGVLAWMGRLAFLPPVPPIVRLVLAGAMITALVFGLMAIRTGLSGVLWRARAGDRTPQDPWRWDHPWEQGVAEDMQGAGLLSGWITILAFGCCLAPILALAVTLRESRGIPWFVLVIAGLFALIYLLILGAHAWRTVVRLTHGAKRLRLTRFPYFTGDEVTVALERGESLRRLARLTATLRCVQETMERRGKNARVVARELWAETVELQGGTLQAYGNEIPLQFQPPADAPTTHLERMPKTYWELEMKADVPGPDWNARFLLPVYRRS